MHYIAFLLLLLLLSCSPTDSRLLPRDRYAHITDTTARAIIRASIADAGGLEKWESIKRLRFTKDYQLLLESGEVEMDYRQSHDYQWEPLVIDIRSEEKGAIVHTRLENGHYSRTKDGETVDTPQEALQSAVNSATYVVSLPFKLLDPAARIEYVGQDSLNGKAVEVLAVSYPSDERASNAGSEVWKYYFDPATGRIVANWVKSGDHFSLIENQSYVRADGILFNQKRQSFRVDSLGRKLYLRAEYWYGGFEVE